MADKPIDGEIIEGTVTGRLVRHLSPETQLVPARAPLPKEQEETAQRLLAHIDTREVEERLFNSYAGGFIGLCYDDETENTPPEMPAERRIILTDKDDSLL